MDTRGQIEGPVKLRDPSNPWARISEIAVRVGVKPHSSGVASIVAKGADGQVYDVFEVVAAVLDRIDNATK